MKKDLLAVSDLSKDEVLSLFELTRKLKKEPGSYSNALSGKCIGLVFEKPSNRTRVSFEIGMVQLGGYAVYLGPSELEMGKRESVKDVSCVLSRYLNGIIARTYAHEELEEMARYATVPVINGLSDKAHPCQALCDVFTVYEKFGTFKGVTLAYFGDGNNVLNSLLVAASKVGLAIRLAIPKGYEPDSAIVAKAKKFARQSGSKISLCNSTEEAARGADVLYTDVWVSMGQEKETAKRLKAFKAFQVNGRILKLAKKGCLVMHCLPAHRGQEITDEVIDSKHSIVYDQAENRLHTEKAILLRFLQ